MSDIAGHPILLVMVVAVLAPLLAEIPTGFRIPVVVLEMILGFVIGPGALGWASPEGLISFFGTAGLAALFFMAGMELDLDRVRGRPITLGAAGWVISLGLGIAVAAALYSAGITDSTLLLAVAFTSTTLGTITPIIKDAGIIESRFGRMVLAAGAMAEFGPVVMISLVLTHGHSTGFHLAAMLGLAALTVILALITLRVRPPKMVEILSRTLHTSSQLPVRISMLLILALFVLAKTFDLEPILGAFAAGMVFGLASRGKEGKPLREKVEAVSFGFFVPFFFVSSGMNFDAAALVQNPGSLLLVPMFLLIFLLVRGTPVLIYRNDLGSGERLPFVLYSATSLPIVVAITDIGLRTGDMKPEIATGLVGAAMLSVLLFPALANTILSKAAKDVSTEKV